MAEPVSHADEVKVVSRRFGQGAANIDRYLELDGYKAKLFVVMIGEFLIMKSNRIGVLTLCALLGSILFYAVMYVGRYYGYVVRMTPNDLSLIKGILIIMLLVLTQSKKLRKAAVRAVVKND